ncbi:response regulator transcription factor [Haloimpatiens sp. FM7330]|uniref:response regulator transcription factor n=1 Tax=Haloimpatiens sp. FM7330 TaxID=3298610 RepID=UPI0036315271
MERILLLEDDEALAMGIEYSLMEQSFQVEVVGTVKEAKENIDKNSYDIAILDINLPDGTGYEVCKYINDKKDIPVIFLTALDEEVNVILGLDMGADDYITKPFRVRELISRVKAVLRRTKKSNVSSTYILKSGNIIFNVKEANIIKKDKKISLTAQEYRLLQTFMEKPNEVVSKDELISKIFSGETQFVDDNTISVYIKRLRKKIEDDVKDPQYIINKRGIGYLWNIDVEVVE